MGIVFWVMIAGDSLWGQRRKEWCCAGRVNGTGRLGLVDSLDWVCVLLVCSAPVHQPSIGPWSSCSGALQWGSCIEVSSIISVHPSYPRCMLCAQYFTVYLYSTLCLGLGTCFCRHLINLLATKWQCTRPPMTCKNIYDCV
jgi:hypothetical protein